MLEIRKLSMGFGKKSLFQDVDLILLPTNRYGIVGANGTGKSTFLKILAGEESSINGTVEKAKSLNIGILKQDHFRYEEDRLIDVVIQGNSILWAALTEKDKLYTSENFTEEDGYRLSELEEIIMQQEGYEAESTAKNLLLGLGIAEKYHYGPLMALSGGYKLRVLLAQVLFQKPDIMLLDEPTNHLDIVSIAWLEQFLKTFFTGLLIFISHDRGFLNNVSTHILDIDYDTILNYPGNYDKFVKAKEERLFLKQCELKNQEKKIEAMQTFVDRFGAKASKASQAASRQKMIDKIQLVEIKDSNIFKPFFNFQQKKPTGKSVINVSDIHKHFNEKILLRGATFALNRGDKCAIIGPNGIGKSTLLKILLDELKPDQGQFEWSEAVNVGYFSQDYRTQLDPGQTVLQWLEDHVVASSQDIRKVLGQVLFRGSDVDKKIAMLSGGESARLVMAKLILEKHNCLILDEPTNHLDLESIDALIESLQAFPGTVLFVSHNRHFIDSISTRVLVLTEQYGAQNYLGNYKDYLEQFGKDYLTKA
ncbi:ABC-F family ATP-binding cassette domain-containing protein [Legionella jamestowniensis]|uniref:Probable ATP-binding protein YbiT n=1 Tax=Legionella jamestowniensis TaxID=455 RepID=A0A0W0UGN4_9GAMM|nr:ABC-F family ATP-binding cassette domain-containing protein [Legionella jamestowniensis]KTD07074.1 putative ABC transporter ATP-binding protein ybiT [Legionella jamestowniensis]OCH98069.1 ABC-F family ATPase [Legionella jamestowniensis]SFL70548.1 ATPase components of ABC transporters with duplicated ATPase domains [Legionella jamestowniensis DSM 19215]